MIISLYHRACYNCQLFSCGLHCLLYANTERSAGSLFVYRNFSFVVLYSIQKTLTVPYFPFTPISTVPTAYILGWLGKAFDLQPSKLDS